MTTEHHSFPDSAGIPAAIGPYSHAVVAGDFVFIAGQVARDGTTGEFTGGDIAAQTTRALEIIAAILGELGLTLADVVRCTIYLAEGTDFAAMNQAYAAVMPAPFPARSVPQVKLPFGALVSIEVTAFRGNREKRPGR